MFKKWFLMGAIAVAAIGLAAPAAEAHGPRHSSGFRGSHLHHHGHHHHHGHFHHGHHHHHHHLHRSPWGISGPSLHLHHHTLRPSFYGPAPIYVRPRSGISLYIGR